MAAGLKAKVSALVEAGEVEALKALALGGQGILRTLISLLYSQDDDLRWRAITALGEVSSAVAAENPERVADLIRRLFWAINDESGGIGWHVPEAIGEVLVRVPRFALTFGPPLASHLEIDPYGPGVLWAIGRLSRVDSRITNFILPRVRLLLSDPDPLKRGRAAWALGQAGDREALPILAGLAGDTAAASVFEEERLRQATVGELAVEAKRRIEERAAASPS